MDINVPSSGEKINIEQDLLLLDYNGMRTRCRAEYGVRISGYRQLRGVLAWAAEHHIPFTVLGEGTHTLISDKGIEGLVILTEKLTSSHINGELLCVRAGVPLRKVIAIAIDHGLAGLEELAGIPGSVGGAIMHNATHNHVSISDRLVYVDYLTSDGEFHRLRVVKETFSPRRSPFLGRDDIFIYEAGLRMRPTRQTVELKHREQKAKEARKRSQQFAFPGCGEIFRQPKPGLKAGDLIESCNLKGAKINGAMVSPHTSGHIINTGGATAQDVKQLADLIIRKVKETHNIELVYDISLKGSW